jgi:Zinc knuckle
LLLQKISRFITVERLKEISYGMDTQVNESFNNTVSWFAPKNKVYCASASLSNRLCMAVGIHSIGLTRFWTRVFKTFSITVTPGITHFLQAKDTVRSNKHAKSKTTAKKKDRMKKRIDKMQDEEAIAKMERSKREGTYRRGTNMDEFGANGYTEEELRQYALAHPKGTSRKRKSSEKQMDVRCKHCDLFGHTTTRSRQCLKYKPPKNNVPQTVALNEQQQLAADAAEELELLRNDALAMEAFTVHVDGANPPPDGPDVRGNL